MGPRLRGDDSEINGYSSLSLDAGGFYHAGPFLQILADEFAESIRAERKRRDLLFGELLDDLRGMHDREPLLGEPLHHLLRTPSPLSSAARAGATMRTHGAFPTPGPFAAPAGRAGSAGMRLGSATASATNWPA